MTGDWLSKKTYPLDGHDRLCMAIAGESHYWRGRRKMTTGSIFQDCPQHDGAERSHTTEPLHVHECYGCSGVFSHKESGCWLDRPGHVVSIYSQRFTCWNCSREGR